MAKKRTATDDKKKPKPPNRTGVPLHVYIPPELDAALTACAAAERRKVTAEVIMALEAHLKAKGYWTPKPPAGE